MPITRELEKNILTKSNKIVSKLDNISTKINNLTKKKGFYSKKIQKELSKLQYSTEKKFDQIFPDNELGKFDKNRINFTDFYATIMYLKSKEIIDLITDLHRDYKVITTKIQSEVDSLNKEIKTIELDILNDTMSNNNIAFKDGLKLFNRVRFTDRKRLDKEIENYMRNSHKSRLKWWDGDLPEKI